MSIITLRFDSKASDKVKQTEFGKDWPVVYILEDGHEMYIGETVSASSRFKQHYEKLERRKLSRAHLIADEEYNKSAALDIESSLIQFMAADEKYVLQNGNLGLSDHSYYDRQKYTAKFEVIWQDLQEKGLAQKDLIQLKNSDVFKYSPYKALTDEQLNIVERIRDSLIFKDYKTHIVNGEPGTGKSVLATFLLKYLKEYNATKDLNIALVVPQAGLRTTIKKVFSKVKGLNSSMVIGPSGVIGNQYDLLIVDEAHRLRRRVNLSSYGPFDYANRYYDLGNEGTQLDWIMLASKSQVLLYDGNQSVVPGDIRKEKLQSLKGVEYRLTSQLRVMAGNDYIHFVDDLLALRRTKKADFGKYDLRYFDYLSDMVNEIKDKNKKHDLARIVAGYAWTWESKKNDTKDYDIELDGLKLKWNSTNIDWVNSKNAVDEVGCIHTVQGYDLNYVGVIIGPELSYDTKNNKLRVDKDKYMDFNGKRSIESLDELEKYIINIYKTLLTRGIKGTYIHAVDKNLGIYISGRLKYIQ
ncbi:MAG: DNA/RNA helicase domain-containing protein [Candidatus Saccharimonadales bacterium]